MTKEVPKPNKPLPPEAEILTGDLVSDPLQTVPGDSETRKLTGPLSAPDVTVDQPSHAAVQPTVKSKSKVSDSPEALRGQIAHFRVLTTLGSGGFGIVVRAYDTQLDREVAVKIIRSQSLGTRQLARQFQEEARAAAQLRHPNVVTVHQSGDYGDEQVFIVYDYIRGTTLRDVLRERRPLPPKEAIWILARISRALGYAHAKGIVHRDVKPENVLIEEETREPHVADFGCARRTQWEAVGARRSGTAAQNFVGTPIYFSPEQASGRSETAGAPADVWALGIMMDEMLTGERPFHEHERNRTQLMDAIQHVTPTPIRQRTPEIDRDLAAIWNRCLKKDPKERYESAAQLADDLENWQRGLPVSVRPINLAERFVRFGKRNPMLASSMAGLFLAITLGLAFSLWFYSRELVSKRENVRTQIQQLYREPPAGVAAILRSLNQDYLRAESQEALQQQWLELQHDTGEDAERQKLRVALAQFRLLLSQRRGAPVAELRNELTNFIYRASPDELELILDNLPLSAGDDTFDQLQSVAEDELEVSHRRLRATCAIVHAARDELPAQSRKVYAARCVEFLQGELGTNADLSLWVPLLMPLREELQAPLQGAIRGDRIAVGRLLYHLYADDLQFLFEELQTAHDAVVPDLMSSLSAQLKKELDPQSVWTRIGEEAERAASQLNGLELDQAKARLWLVALRGTDETFVEPIPILNDQGFPTAATYFTHRAFAFNVPLPRLISMIRATLDQELSAATQVYLLALSHYSPESDFEQLKRILLQAADNPHSGVHATAHWLMTRWKIPLPEPTPEISDYVAPRNWRIGADGRLWIRPPETQRPFYMGSSPEDLLIAKVEQISLRQPDSEPLHERIIPWDFEISANEITVGDYMVFLEDRIADVDRALEAAEQVAEGQAIDELDATWGHLQTQRSYLSNSAMKEPVTQVSWYDAAAYCVWLSQQEGLESCYGSIEEIEDARQRLREIKYQISRNGYRLPLPSEWEYACRAGSRTVWSFGNDESMIGQYATCSLNSNDRLWPVQSRKPNRWGFFDMLGNAEEWTADIPKRYPETEHEPYVEPEQSDANGSSSEQPLGRETRGGDYTRPAQMVRSACRRWAPTSESAATIGFRLARTLPNSN